MVLEKTLESPLDCKEIQLVHPKGDQSWVFIGRTDAEAETPILWPPDAKSWLIWNDPDVGKDWRQEEKGTTEDEMVGWHQWLNGDEFEALGVGQGGLVCCGPWGRKELDTTEQLNWMFSRLIYLVACICTPFLSITKWLCKHNLFYSLSFDAYLGCFHFLPIMNAAAVNIHVQVFMWTHVSNSLGCINGSAFPGPYSNFNINYQNFFHSSYTILHYH